MDEDREGDVGEEDGSVGEGGGGANTGREGIKVRFIYKQRSRMPDKGCGSWWCWNVHGGISTRWLARKCQGEIGKRAGMNCYKLVPVPRAKACSFPAPIRLYHVRANHLYYLFNKHILIVQLHSSMCFLRGLIHLRLGAMDYAKENLMEALVIDVKNYDAFKELVEGKMMQPDEGQCLSPLLVVSEKIQG